MKLKLQYINNKRAFCFCPFHESRKGTADLEICLSGKYQGKYYCFSCGQSGYLPTNVLNKLLKSRKKSSNRDTSPLDFESQTNLYCRNFWDNNLPKPFDVADSVIRSMRIGWDGKAYTIPMCQRDKVVGIQRRYPNGFKCMVEGSQLGLIIPMGSWNTEEPLYITEGASDLAVLLECGFQGFGRPSCRVIVETTVEFCEPFKAIIIVNDNDEPGRRGAKQLAGKLPAATNKMLRNPSPFNDLRDYYMERGKQATRLFLRS